MTAFFSILLAISGIILIVHGCVSLYVLIHNRRIDKRREKYGLTLSKKTWDKLLNGGGYYRRKPNRIVTAQGSDTTED